MEESPPVRSGAGLWALAELFALTIWAVEELAGLVSATARRHLHLVAITGLFLLLAVEAVKATTGLRGPPLAAVGAAGGLLGGALYAGLSWPRLWLRFLTPAPLVFALLFLIFGRRQVRNGPANWAKVLEGTTDTLVRGSKGVRGLYQFGAAADLVHRAPASVGPVGGAPATAVLDDHARSARSAFLWRPGPGRSQLQLYLAGGGGRPRPRPVSVAA